MRTLYSILVLAVVYTLTTSLSCCKPIDGNRLLEPGSRNWLPVQGRTSLTFHDENGTPHSFPLQVVDTLEITQDGCGNEYELEYVRATLFINPSRMDSIELDLYGPSQLNITMRGGFGTYLQTSGLIHNQEPGFIERRTNLSLGGTIFPKAVLVLPYPPQKVIIDSFYVADGAGLVGFKYLGRRYTL